MRKDICTDTGFSKKKSGSQMSGDHDAQIEKSVNAEALWWKGARVWEEWHSTATEVQG